MQTSNEPCGFCCNAYLDNGELCTRRCFRYYGQNHVHLCWWHESVRPRPLMLGEEAHSDLTKMVQYRRMSSENMTNDAAERLREDLAFAAPEMWMVHIERRMEEHAAEAAEPYRTALDELVKALDKWEAGWQTSRDGYGAVSMRKQQARALLRREVGENDRWPPPPEWHGVGE